MVAKKYPDKSNRDKTNIAMTSRASEMSIEMRMHSQSMKNLQLFLKSVQVG